MCETLDVRKVLLDPTHEERNSEELRRHLATMIIVAGEANTDQDILGPASQEQRRAVVAAAEKRAKVTMTGADCLAIEILDSVVRDALLSRNIVRHACLQNTGESGSHRLTSPSKNAHRRPAFATATTCGADPY